MKSTAHNTKRNSFTALQIKIILKKIILKKSYKEIYASAFYDAAQRTVRRCRDDVSCALTTTTKILAISV